MGTILVKLSTNKTYSSLEIKNISRRSKAISKCDVGAVKGLIGNVDINTTDHRGVSPLHLAVHKNCAEIVKLLLAQSNIQVGDAALLAIASNNVELSAIILDKLKQTNPRSEFLGFDGSTAYPSYVTPMMLAAQYGHYKIISLLRSRGHSLEHPHPPGCGCAKCEKMRIDYDKLTVVNMRISQYRAVSNPAYMCQTSKDPLLTSFRLIKDLKNWTAADTVSSREYSEIAANLSQFSVDWMDETFNQKEIETILKRKEGWVYSGQTAYPRLMLAMIYDHKPFVGHILVQQTLEELWYGDFAAWRYYGWPRMLLVVFLRMFLIPVMGLLMLLAPGMSFVRRHIHSPVSRFSERITMYLLFLVVLFWQNNSDRHLVNRGFPQTYAEPFFILFTFGYLWRTFRLLMLQGIARYFRFAWNVWDFAMQMTLFTVIVFWVLAFMNVKSGAVNINEERKNWPSLEPILIAEALLVLGTVMAFIRFLFVLQLHPRLGPLQISLARMVRDCFVYFVIIGFVMLAFVAGINRLYEYYDGMKDPSGTSQVSSFISIWSTFKTLFWSIFALSPVEAGNVVIDNGKTHEITQAVGSFLYALFMFLMIVIVLNMLIATLSNTFQRISDNMIDEWAVAKTEVYLEHFDGSFATPVPFNLLIGPFVEIIDFLKDLRNKNKKWKCSLFHGCFMVDRIAEDDTSYYAFMTILKKRYFLKKCGLYKLSTKPEAAGDFCSGDED